MQLILGGLLDIIEPILGLSSDDERSALISDVLGLINALLPGSMDETAAEEIHIGFNQKLIPSQAPDSRYQLYLVARKKLDAEKIEFFANQDKAMLSQLSKSILPRIFEAYS